MCIMWPHNSRYQVDSSLVICTRHTTSVDIQTISLWGKYPLSIMSPLHQMPPAWFLCVMQCTLYLTVLYYTVLYCTAMYILSAERSFFTTPDSVLHLSTVEASRCFQVWPELYKLDVPRSHTDRLYPQSIVPRHQSRWPKCSRSRLCDHIAPSRV